MQVSSEIDEHRAAVLIGISTTDLRRLAREAAVGHPGASAEELMFSYEELRRLCLLAARSHD